MQTTVTLSPLVDSRR